VFLATLGLAGLSGLLSTLSPCVLPLLPIVAGSAASAHRLGPWALAAGLAFSFTALGIFLATGGLSLGLNASAVRLLAGYLMIGFSLLFLVPALQTKFEQATTGLTSRAGSWSDRFALHGLAGQFGIGLLLGAVWTPCAGPTLGAAITLASTGQDIGSVSLTMMVFGLAAALPLALMGWITQKQFLKVRSRLSHWSVLAKKALGIMFMVVGLGIVTGYDHVMEAWLLVHAPQSLTQLTTQF